jgi:hypothetical protein
MTHQALGFRDQPLERTSWQPECVSKELRLKSDKFCHTLVSFTTYFKQLLHAITIGGWKLLANATSIPSNRKLASTGGCHRKSGESLLHVSKADILELWGEWSSPIHQSQFSF